MPRPESPQTKSGLYARAGASATATAAAWLKRFDAPMTNVSKMYFSFSRVWERARDALGGGRARVGGPPLRPGAAAGRRSAHRGARLAVGHPERAGVAERVPRAGPRHLRRFRRCGDRGLGAGRVGHLGAAGRRRRVDDDGEVDRDAEVAAQRVADRAAQYPLDGVLGELAGRGEQRGAVDEPERSGQAEERALLRGQGRCARARRAAPERSPMTRFQTCPRSPAWSATGSAPPSGCRPVKPLSPWRFFSLSTDLSTAVRKTVRGHARALRAARGPTESIPPDRLMEAHASNRDASPTRHQ